MKAVIITFLIVLNLNSIYAQRGHGHGPANSGRGHGKTVVHHKPGPGHKVVHHVHHRSPYRPTKVVVYRPHWGPQYSYHRRWIYFPHRNLYWDNWRNHYVFYNGVVWISQPAPPKGLSNKELEKEKKHELNEDEDDVDDVYKNNDKHKE